tara:strand:+ start:724 stop:954 length:231 start_codon:yes stop_codon:yes gene_type:complete
MEINVTTLISLLTLPVAAGAAYGGVKVGLNGMRQSIMNIENLCNRLDDKVDQHGERLAAVETEAGNLKERLSNVGG